MSLAEAAFARYSCRKPTLMRPPYGSINPSVREVLYKMGYRAVLWNADTLDWQDAATNPSLVLSNFGAALDAVQGAGVISLQHDIEPAPVSLVPDILNLIKSKGYPFSKFVPMEQCLYGNDYLRHPSRVYGLKNCGTAVAKWPVATAADPCPVSEWSEWSLCDTDCGNGKQTRVRLTMPPGQEKVSIQCNGIELVQQQACTVSTSCSGSCSYGKWTNWGACSATCGGGTRMSVRTVSGSPCQGPVQTELCNMQPCFSASPSPSATRAVVTPSVTPSMSLSISVTSSPSVSKSVSASATGTATSSGSITLTRTPTRTSSATSSLTLSVSISRSSTVSPSLSATRSVTLSATSSTSVSASVTPSITPSPTHSLSSGASPSSTATVSVTSSATPSITPPASTTPSASASVSVSQHESFSSTRSISVTPSNTPTTSPAAEPSVSGTVSITASPSASAAGGAGVVVLPVAQGGTSETFIGILVGGIAGVIVAIAIAMLLWKRHQRTLVAHHSNYSIPSRASQVPMVHNMDHDEESQRSPSPQAVDVLEPAAAASVPAAPEVVSPPVEVQRAVISESFYGPQPLLGRPLTPEEDVRDPWDEYVTQVSQRARVAQPPSPPPRSQRRSASPRARSPRASYQREVTPWVVTLRQPDSVPLRRSAHFY